MRAARCNWSLALRGLLCALLVSHLAWAQDGATASADALFHAGRDAMKAGDYAAACENFRESQRVDPAPGTTLNLALCEEKLGHLTSAWRLFEQARKQLLVDDERAAIAREGEARVSARLPRVTLRLSPNCPPDTRVSRNGVPLAHTSFDTTLPMDPGPLTLEVVAPGHAQKQIVLTLAEGDQREIAIEPGSRLLAQEPPAPAVSPPAASGPAAGQWRTNETEPPATHAPSPPPDEPPSPNVGTTVGYALAGVGVASVILGSVTGLMVIQKKDQVQDHCDPDRTCDQEGLDAAKEGQRLSTISTVSWAVGAGALGAGLYLLLTADEPESPSAAVGVTLVGRAPGLGAHARF